MLDVGVQLEDRINMLIVMTFQSEYPTSQFHITSALYQLDPDKTELDLHCMSLLYQALACMIDLKMGFSAVLFKCLNITPYSLILRWTTSSAFLT